MFMRLVQVKVKPELADQITEVYVKTILPTLQRTPGCLHASLIRSVTHSGVQVTTSDDITIGEYKLVSGKTFH